MRLSSAGGEQHDPAFADALFEQQRSLIAQAHDHPGVARIDIERVEEFDARPAVGFGDGGVG